MIFIIQKKSNRDLQSLTINLFMSIYQK